MKKTNHAKVHTQQKTTSCPLCPKKLAMESHLRQHMISHENTKKKEGSNNPSVSSDRKDFLVRQYSIH